MSISFIITTYNVAEYIGECLESLLPCLRPGDQVVLVDDGSTDGTTEIIGEFVDRGGFGTDIRWTPVWLSANTIGGIGIPGNIGMDHAVCDTIFFVDGDDYLIPDEFLRVRREYEANPTDIWFADYLEFDQKVNRTKPPADVSKWDKLTKAVGSEAIRLPAIALIAVPWRKFYNTEFLRRNRIRFPDGGSFLKTILFTGGSACVRKPLDLRDASSAITASIDRARPWLRLAPSLRPSSSISVRFWLKFRMIVATCAVRPCVGSSVICLGIFPAFKVRYSACTLHERILHYD